MPCHLRTREAEATVLDEILALRDENNRLRAVIKTIAKQPKLDELEEDEGDVDAGYDGVVEMAREALAKLSK